MNEEPEITVAHIIVGLSPLALAAMYFAKWILS